MARKPVRRDVQADVVTKSRRRCALCVFLDDDRSEKEGQIAHLNRKSSDSRFENLVWLCFKHHNRFDSTTSTSKNYIDLEIKDYRDRLYAEYQNATFSQEDISLCQAYIRKYAGLFTAFDLEGTELAYRIHETTHQAVEEIANFWVSNPLRSFKPEIREIQDRISENMGGVLSIYDANSYNWVGDYILFDIRRIGGAVLDDKKAEMGSFISAILEHYEALDSIAVM